MIKRLAYALQSAPAKPEKQVHAVLHEMRSPDFSVLKAGVVAANAERLNLNAGDLLLLWQAMIDKVLSDEG